MASAVNPLTGTTPVTASTPASGSLSTAPSQEVFLQLLVSQIQNQDPLNPTDSTQFVSQLAQFSELQQVIAIRSDIESAQTASTAQAAGTTTPVSTQP